MNKRVIQNKFKVFILLCLSLSLFSCEYEELEAPSGLPENISFQNDIMPLFNQSCNAIGCHNNGGFSPDLSEDNAYTVLSDGDMLDLINPEKSTLYTRMIDTQSPMPMVGILSERLCFDKRRSTK